MQNTVRLNERPIHVADVADMLGYSKGYVYQLVMNKEIPFHKRCGGKGSVLFFESELLDWIHKSWEYSPAQCDITERTEKILKNLE